MQQGEPSDHIDPERPEHVVINVEHLIHAQHVESVRSSPVLTVEGIPNSSPLGSIPEQVYSASSLLHPSLVFEN